MTSLQKTSPYLMSCPKCGALIPRNLVGCWSCGECLDPHIIELAKAAKEAKP